MLISLCVMGIAVGLASQAAVVQLRFFRGAGEIIAMRGQAGAVGAIVAATLWGVAPTAGDILFASDSALEVRTAVGSAVVCGGSPGRVTIPASTPRGHALSAFHATPDAGDVADVYVQDSTGAGWIRATVAAAAIAGGACTGFPQTASTLILALREPLLLPAGSVLHLSRPIRLSHYRASDGQWYFGARDWNGSSQRLNTIQPVAGPLEPRSADAAQSGLVFRYLDASGNDLGPSPNVDRVVAITVLTRARTKRPVSVAGLGNRGLRASDSSSTTIALRNAR